MRIHVPIPGPNPTPPTLPFASSSPERSTGGRSTAPLPAPLLELSPNGELVLIELQGSLEMEGVERSTTATTRGEAWAGHRIGGLEWTKGREDKPVLTIAHHRLEGRLVKLQRPLAILQKRERVVQEMEMAVAGAEMGSTNPSDPGRPDAVRKRKRPEGDNGNAGVESGLALVREADGKYEERRDGVLGTYRDAHDFSSSSPVRGVIGGRGAPEGEDSDGAYRFGKARLRGRELENGEGEDETRNSERGETAAGGEEEGGEEHSKEKDRIFYDVVTIVRRKLVFSKRPEPIMKLDGT